MTLEESREIIPLMESMIGQIEEQQTLMAEMILERELPEKVTLKLPFSHQNSPKSNLFHPQNR